MSSRISAIATKSAAEIGRAIGAGAVRAESLTEHYLMIAEGREEVYVLLCPERALAEARAADRRAALGDRRSRLDGVPISWKDLFDLAGEPSEAGSALLKGQIVARDGEAVRRLARAGLVALGKTHMSELAFSGLGYNPITATAPCAFDETLVAGGSSSGAAASVAMGLAAAAIGSDTGGSVRIPSAWSGLVGLKTTHGAIPLTGTVPLSPSLDTIGPLCRTIEDAAVFYALLTGKREPDLTGASLIGLHFWAAQGAVLEACDPEILDGFEAALARLEGAGAVITRAPIPEFETALQVTAQQGGIVNTEGYAIWGDQLEARPELVYPMVLERFRSGRSFRADQIDGARLMLQGLARAYQRRTAGFDAVLMPTTANLPPKIADLAADPDYAMRQNMLALRNTRLANLLGLCALALPSGRSASGLPLSVSLYGGPFEEARLLRLGAACERALALA
ncbi:MAG: amidase family protein [Neomegalonema sp.]|nr:amidase family protein [Neomegalonema sp.]